MQRSSDSIASLAAPLAKAQAVLVNPEKTLTGTIGPGSPGGRFCDFAGLRLVENFPHFDRGHSVSCGGQILVVGTQLWKSVLTPFCDLLAQILI